VLRGSIEGPCDAEVEIELRGVKAAGRSTGGEQLQGELRGGVKNRSEVSERPWGRVPKGPSPRGTVLKEPKNR